jgi:hypothetical protein
LTQDEEIEFDQLKTARDSLLLTVANLRGQLDTIAAKEREACAKMCEEYAIGLERNYSEIIADKIRARGGT